MPLEGSSRVGPCGQVNHSCTLNDDAVTARVEGKAREIRELLAQLCNTLRKQDLKNMVKHIVNGTEQ